jgi:hypothetical protein
MVDLLDTDTPLSIIAQDRLTGCTRLRKPVLAFCMTRFFFARSMSPLPRLLSEVTRVINDKAVQFSTVRRS